MAASLLSVGFAAPMSRVKNAPVTYEGVGLEVKTAPKPIGIPSLIKRRSIYGQLDQQTHSGWQGFGINNERVDVLLARLQFALPAEADFMIAPRKRICAHRLGFAWPIKPRSPT